MGEALYRIRIELEGRAHDLRLARHPSETAERVVLRALAWALFHEPGIELGPALCRGDEPPLVVPGPTRPRVWIEVGRVDRARLERALRKAERVRWLAPGEAAAPPGVELERVDARLVARLAAGLGRRQTWRLERRGGRLAVAGEAD